MPSCTLVTKAWRPTSLLPAFSLSLLTFMTLFSFFPCAPSLGGNSLPRSSRYLNRCHLVPAAYLLFLSHFQLCVRESLSCPGLCHFRYLLRGWFSVRLIPPCCLTPQTWLIAWAEPRFLHVTSNLLVKFVFLSPSLTLDTEASFKEWQAHHISLYISVLEPLKFTTYSSRVVWVKAICVWPFSLIFSKQRLLKREFTIKHLERIQVL